VKTLEKIAIVAFVPAVLLLVIFFSGESARDVQPARLPPPPLDEWVTFTDDRFHFSFQYPPDWHLELEAADVAGGGVKLSTYPLDSTAFVKGPLPPDYLKIEIDVVGGDPRLAGQTIAEWRHARFDYDPSKVRFERSLVVAGVEALEIRMEYYPGWETTEIYMPFSHPAYGDTAMWISATPFGLPILEQIYRDIVSSFQFTK